MPKGSARLRGWHLTINLWDTSPGHAAGLAERASTANKKRTECRTCALYRRLLETQDQTAVGRGRIVDAVLIADQAVAVTTQVQQLIPVSAVAGQAGDV